LVRGGRRLENQENAAAARVYSPVLEGDGEHIVIEKTLSLKPSNIRSEGKGKKQS